MKKKTINMTEGNPLKLLIAFTIPMILGNVFQQVYQMVDAIVVGRFVSKEALAAIGATGAILFLMISVIIGFTVGTAIVTAQNAGAHNIKGLKAVFATGIYIVAVETIALTILGNLGCMPALKLLKTPVDILSDANLYLRINFTTCIAPILYNILAQYMRSLGDSKTPLYALIISSVMNIILDLILVIAFDMGVAGVAIATAFSQGVSALYCLYITIKKFPEYLPNKDEIKVDRHILNTILKFGIPMSLQQMAISFGMMFVQSTINGFGTNVVAGYTAGNKVDQISLQFMQAIGSAMSTYAGQNYGARKADRLHEGMKAAMIFNLGLALFLSICIIGLGKYIVLLFMESTETEAIQVAITYLKTVSIFYVLCGISNILQNYLRGVNYVAVPTFSSILELIVKIIISYLFSIQFGHQGIWWAWPISWIITDLYLVGYYYLKATPQLKVLFSSND